nr:MAG TPA: hypothetical protein [Bacteriophage sp.]
MANEVVIDITANFEDNASKQLDQLNKKLENLEEYNNLDINISLESSEALYRLNRMENACNKLESRMKKFTNFQTELTFSINTKQAERNVDRVMQKLSGLTNPTVTVLVNTQEIPKITPSSLSSPVNGSGAIPTAISGVPINNTGTTASYSTNLTQTGNIPKLFEEQDKYDAEPKRKVVDTLVNKGLKIGGSIIGAKFGSSSIGSKIGGGIGDSLGNIPSDFIYGPYVSAQEHYEEYVKNNFGTLSLPQGSINGVAREILGDNKVPLHSDESQPDSSGLNKESFKFLLGNKMLSHESYLEVYSQMQDIGLSTMPYHLDQMQNTVSNSQNEEDYENTKKVAQADFYQNFGNSLSGTSDAKMNFFQEIAGSKFGDAQEIYQQGTQNYLKNLPKMGNFGKYIDGVEIGDWNLEPQKLSEKLGFSKLNDDYKFMAREVYASSSLEMEALEKTTANTIATGGDASGQRQSLLNMYAVGAAGGDPVALQKYWGAALAGDEESAAIMDQRLSGPMGRQGLSDELYGAYTMFRGISVEEAQQTTPQNNTNIEQTSNSEAVETTSEKELSPYEMFRSKDFQNDIIPMATRSDMPGDELASGTLEMLKESLSAGNIDFKSLGLGESLMGALGEGLSSSEIDFGKLDLGKDLMSKIGESLTSSEIDFTQLDFGKNLMSAIAEGLTESKIDFKDLGLGESLIGQIGKGLTSTEIDFSELGFGENLMAAIVKGLTDTEIDFKGLGLGESLISQIGEGLTSTEIDFSELGFGENLMAAIVKGLTDTEIDFSELGFGENLMTVLVAGLTESDIDFEGLGLGESLMSLIGESLTDTEINFSEMGFGENLMSALVAGLTESEIDFEGLGIGETIMSMLGESLSAIDFSESGVGESMMASIANAFSSVSFEEMDLGGLGEGLSASIASSLGELDLSSITEQFSILSENPIQLEAVDNASPAIQQVQAAVEGLIAMTPNVNIGANDEASGTIASVSKALDDLNGKTATVNIGSNKTGEFATGTLGAEGGLALINDEATADPRELIERNGRYMMYEGKNVLTVLEPNDRVYTASQTKTIMANMGVPYYAKGKNNNIISSGGGIIPTSGSGSSGSGVAVGGVNLSINVSGGDADVIDQIKKRGEEVAEYIAGTISSRLSDAYANTPVATE